MSQTDIEMKGKGKSKRSGFDDEFNANESTCTLAKKLRGDAEVMAEGDVESTQVEVRVLDSTQCTGVAPPLFSTKNKIVNTGFITVLSADTVIEIRRKLQVFVESLKKNFCGQIYIVDTEPSIASNVSNIMSRKPVFNLPLPLVAIYIRVFDKK